MYTFNAVAARCLLVCNYNRLFFTFHMSGSALNTFSKLEPTCDTFSSFTIVSLEDINEKSNLNNTLFLIYVNDLCKSRMRGKCIYLQTILPLSTATMQFKKTLRIFSITRHSVNRVYLVTTPRSTKTVTPNI